MIVTERSNHHPASSPSPKESRFKTVDSKLTWGINIHVKAILQIFEMLLSFFGQI